MLSFGSESWFAIDRLLLFDDDIIDDIISYISYNYDVSAVSIESGLL